MLAAPVVAGWLLPRAQSVWWPSTRARARFSVSLAMATIAGVQALELDRGRRQVFVIGNEAADADSLVSAYAMAQLVDSDEAQGVALVQIPREEFCLRGDALALFRYGGGPLAADGSPARLVFWDEVDWDAVHSLQDRSLVLTDHNKMTEEVARYFEGRVGRVLDHHADTGSYPQAEVIIDEALGSACTLVAEEFWAEGKEMPAEVGKLLAGVIVLDTRNFDPKAAKGTSRDRRALDGLSAFIPPHGCDRWYAELMEARKDVSHLSVRELLLLDLKTATAGDGGLVAFASVSGAVRDVCARAGGPASLLGEAEALARSRGYAALAILFGKDSAGSKAVVFVPGCSGQRGAGMCESMAGHLARAGPDTVGEAFRGNPLFASQGILEEGFGLAPWDSLEPLRAFALRGPISRKTLLPYAMSASAL